MFGPRLTTVFRSRWRAVWFVASVLLGVYFMVPRQGADDDADARRDAEAVASLMQEQGTAPSGQPEKHVNPWAKASPGR